MGIIDSLMGAVSKDAAAQEQPFTVVGVDGKPMQVTDSQLAGMDWGTLQQLRVKNKDGPTQERLAPFEHRAYAREQVADNPAMGIVMPVMAAGYQAKKVGEAAIGVPRGPTDTPPSMEQLKQGIIGTGEGIAAGARKLWNGKAG